ncbi:MAG TPA: hypothetical protein VGF99_17755 [Myxococcota bacterium]
MTVDLSTAARCFVTGDEDSAVEAPSGESPIDVGSGAHTGRTVSVTCELDEERSTTATATLIVAPQLHALVDARAVGATVDLFWLASGITTDDTCQAVTTAATDPPDLRGIAASGAQLVKRNHAEVVGEASITPSCGGATSSAINVRFGNADKVTAGTNVVIVGNLLITGGSTTEFAALRFVTGTVSVVDNPGGLLFTANSLVRAQALGLGSPTQGNSGSSQTFTLNALRSVRGALSVENNEQLVGLNLPALRHVGGAMTIANNASLASLAMSALATVEGRFVVFANQELQTLTTTALGAIGGDIEIRNNRFLDCTIVDALTCAIDPNPSSGDVLVTGNDHDNNNGTPAASCVITPSCVTP